MKREKHHYIPASLIGRFSADVSGPLRKRRVMALYKGKQHSRPCRAENLGLIRGFYSYDVDEDPGHDVDAVWSEYEKRLPNALGLLRESALPHIDSEIWLRVLVPFVTAFLVRGPDFNERNEMQIGSFREFFERDLGRTFRDNTNGVRVLEMQRLLVVFMCADWHVLHAPLGVHFVGSDVGYALARTAGGSSGRKPSAFVFPLSSTEVLQVTPNRENEIAFWAKSGWRSWVRHGYLREEEVASLNQSIAAFARSFIVGSCGSVVEELADELSGEYELHALEPHVFDIPKPRRLRDLDMEWFRVVTAIGRDPVDSRLADFDIDYETVGKGWYPVVFLCSNRIASVTGLNLRRNSIWLTLSDDGPSALYS